MKSTQKPDEPKNVNFSGFWGKFFDAIWSLFFHTPTFRETACDGFLRHPIQFASVRRLRPV